MISRFAAYFSFAFLAVLFCLPATVSFATADSKAMIFGKPYVMRTVLVCEDKDEALSMAQTESEFFKENKPREEFYKEIYEYPLACEVIKEEVFILLESIHQYTGYNSKTTESLEWSIIKAKTKPHTGKTYFLFLPTSDVLTYMDINVHWPLLRGSTSQ